ncbi:unnamed protein product [Caenorhabditis bovis]|uniref:Uncharacterized protein n=1 Tax=Caenorhabditis bovis TaxID=2654633 RepID=A0A8S1FAT1_9PELO|nr:unnamed protein product [Caenorhabditis bovis]
MRNVGHCSEHLKRLGFIADQDEIDLGNHWKKLAPGYVFKLTCTVNKTMGNNSPPITREVLIAKEDLEIFVLQAMSVGAEDVDYGNMSILEKKIGYIVTQSDDALVKTVFDEIVDENHTYLEKSLLTLHVEIVDGEVLIKENSEMQAPRKKRSHRGNNDKPEATPSKKKCDGLSTADK